MDHPYPDHIYDATRRKIAAELIQHELRKLLQSVPAELWQKIDHDVEGWFEGERYELAAAHDYWNAADGLLRGFKLKSLVRYITAENVTWKLAQVPVEAIDLTAQLPVLSRFGKPPYDTRELATAIATDPELKRELLADSNLHAASSQPRDHYPVVLMKQPERYAIGDGNRRVLRALLHERPQIEAWVARQSRGEPLRNYWVSTGFLRQLGEQALVAQETHDQATVDALRLIVRRLFDQSSIARINFDLRVRENYGLLDPR